MGARSSWAIPGGTSQMERTQRQTTHDHEASVEDLGEDVMALALAVAAEARARASVLRRVNGVLVRVIVEVA
jgi:hypothetical protein